MDRVVHRTCTLCEACCGITVHVEDEQVRTIRGDAEDPLSRGHICSKVWGLKDLHEDPDRLRQPLRREGDSWTPISWREAFDQAAEGLNEVRRRHGKDSLASYIGEPVVHNLGALLFSNVLVGALGARRRFSSNTLDQFPKQLVCHWLYGSGFLIPVPDVDRTDHILILGANPVVSNGSLLTAPGIRRRLEAIRKRGGSVIVIDPVRTETARLADSHHFIRPGTDPLLLAAMIQCIASEDQISLGRLEPFLRGVEQVVSALSDLTPEAVCERVGIEAKTIRSLARSFCDAKSAVCYGRMGTSTVRFGTVTSWLIEVLNLLTGNLDRVGGALFPQPAFDVVSMQPPTRRGRWKSRVRGIPEFMGELPTATLAEEIETPGEGRIRGLVTLAGNPVLSGPGGQGLDRALVGLEFMVAIDYYRNETSRHANLILPPVGPLERDHYDVAFQLFAVRNSPHWSPRVFEPPARSRTDADILLELSRRLLAGRGGIGRLSALPLAALTRVGGERAAALAVAFGLRAGPNGSRFRPWRPGVTLKAIRAAPHGLDLGPLQPGLPERLANKERLIQLAPDEILAEIPKLHAMLAEQPPALALIGRRERRSVNSWSHNLPSLVRGPNRCTLDLHPEDAESRGIRAGDTVRVSSRVGSIAVPARISDSMMRGVVSLPHGYGHDRPNLGMEIAAQHAGASMNDLTDPEQTDALSGNAVLSGIPVSVRPEPA